MKKPTIIGFYGYSDSGKTMLIEQLIQGLITQGKRVAAVKQSGHEVSIDRDGKDTYRFSKAGADPVVLVSVSETAIKIHKPLSIKEIIKKITTDSQIDIIIVESAHDREIPKIRIGDIEERENTIKTYDGNLDKLMQIILQMEAQNVSGDYQSKW